MLLKVSRTRLDLSFGKKSENGETYWDNGAENGNF